MVGLSVKGPEDVRIISTDDDGVIVLAGNADLVIDIDNVYD